MKTLPFLRKKVESEDSQRPECIIVNNQYQIKDKIDPKVIFLELQWIFYEIVVCNFNLLPGILYFENLEC